MSFRAVACFVAAALLPAPAALAQTPEVRCNYSRKVECGPKGCSESPIGSAYLLLPRIQALADATVRAEHAGELPTIRRCDATGCRVVTVRASESGAYVVLAQPDGAYFLKIITDGSVGGPPGDFVEVSAIGLGTNTYYGSCKAVVTTTGR